MNIDIGSETFLLRLTDGSMVLADLDIREQWDSINLYWPNSDGYRVPGLPEVWVGDDGGYEKELHEVYSYSGIGFSDTFDVFSPYDKETFIRRVIQKRDKYYPGYEKDTQDILMRMEPT